MTPPVLAILIPCFNEEAVLPETIQRIESLIARLIAAGEIDQESRAWFVDDGSTDRTWSIVATANNDSDSRVCGIKLSRNRGHQIALLAGLMSAKGDVLISIDADLQDDLEAIPKMLAEHRAGFDIVYGVRASRTADPFFKRVTAERYYKILRWLGVEVVYNHADFRLMSRRAAEALRCHAETNIFLRGLIPQLGFPSTVVEYVRNARFAGETKYPLSKMIGLAWQGVTSFSTAPLRLITGLGIFVSILSLGMGLWALWVRIFTEQAVPGWASIVIPIFLISGVQLLSLGIIGEYLAKVFLETKRRPLYFVERMALTRRELEGRAGSQPLADGTESSEPTD